MRVYVLTEVIYGKDTDVLGVYKNLGDAQSHASQMNEKHKDLRKVMGYFVDEFEILG